VNTWLPAVIALVAATLLAAALAVVHGALAIAMDICFYGCWCYCGYCCCPLLSLLPLRLLLLCKRNTNMMVADFAASAAAIAPKACSTPESQSRSSLPKGH
jgi:hypothetical protein